MNSGRGDRCRLEGNNIGIPGAVIKHMGRAGIHGSGVRDCFQNVKLGILEGGGRSMGRQEYRKNYVRL